MKLPSLVAKNRKICVSMNKKVIGLTLGFVFFKFDRKHFSSFCIVLKNLWLCLYPLLLLFGWIIKTSYFRHLFLWALLYNRPPHRYIEQKNNNKNMEQAAKNKTFVTLPDIIIEVGRIYFQKRIRSTLANLQTSTLNLNIDAQHLN